MAGHFVPHHGALPAFGKRGQPVVPVRFEATGNKNRYSLLDPNGHDDGDAEAAAAALGVHLHGAGVPEPEDHYAAEVGHPDMAPAANADEGDHAPAPAQEAAPVHVQEAAQRGLAAACAFKAARFFLLGLLGFAITSAAVRAAHLLAGPTSLLLGTADRDLVADMPHALFVYLSEEVLPIAPSDFAVFILAATAALLAVMI